MYIIKIIFGEIKYYGIISGEIGIMALGSPVKHVEYCPIEKKTYVLFSCGNVTKEPCLLPGTALPKEKFWFFLGMPNLWEEKDLDGLKEKELGGF